MNSIKLYQIEILFRDKLKHISLLSPTSKKKCIISCPTCSKEFKRYCSVLFDTGNFECQTCTLKTKLSKILPVGETRNKLTVVSASERKGHSIFLCECGKIAEVENWSFLSNRTTSCGCNKTKAMQYAQSCQKKDKHPNWKGGISDENNLLRTSLDYKNWRTLVFTRDNYTCKKCNKNGVLNAHHVEEFANNKELIYDVENGITFCEKCHRSFHKKYGKSNLSKLQVDEFINIKKGSKKC